MITDLLKQLQLVTAKNPKVPSLPEVAMAAPETSSCHHLLIPEEESLREDLLDLKQLLTPMPKLSQ